jgi:hypothetical protein
MHYLFAFLFVFVLASSCTDEPSQHKSGDDSMITITGNDTNSVAADSSDTAQTAGKYDCSVLRRRVPSAKQKEQLSRDLLELSHCGIDSFDYIYVVPNLFPGWMSENQVQGNDSITYGDFLKHLAEFKKTNAYVQLHDRVNTLDSLRSVAYDGKRVYYMKPVLGRLGFTEPEWEMFLGFSRTYPVPKKGIFTWGDMLDEFEKYSNQNPQ